MRAACFGKLLEDLKSKSRRKKRDLGNQGPYRGGQCDCRVSRKPKKMPGGQLEADQGQPSHGETG